MHSGTLVQKELSPRRRKDRKDGLGIVKSRQVFHSVSSLAEYKKLLCVLCASAVNMGGELPDDHFNSSVPRFSDLVFGMHQGH